jgi:hypothetical protein
MFAFNGGPGFSSLWLHMGVLGPKRVVVSDPGPTPAAAYRTVDHEFGVLARRATASCADGTIIVIIMNLRNFLSCIRVRSTRDRSG